MKAVIIGGSGATGKAVVEQLLANPNYTQVVVLLRKLSFADHPKLQQVLIDFDQMASFATQIQGDVAIACLGTTLKDAGTKDAQWKVDYEYQLQFAQIAKQNNIASFVLLSALGANAESAVFYNKLKGSLENAVQQLNFQQTIIVQPGGLIRPNTNRKGEIIFTKVLMFLNGFGLLKKYEPLPVARVAKALIASVATLPKGLQILSVKEIKTLSI